MDMRLLVSALVLGMSLLPPATHANVSATTCPAVFDIQHKTYGSEWKAYDTDTGEILSEERLTDAVKSADHFALAEWEGKTGQQGMVHCYYRDKHGSDLDIYFAKEHAKPLNTNHAWYAVTGYMHCANDINQCRFKTVILQAEKESPVKHSS